VTNSSASERGEGGLYAFVCDRRSHFSRRLTIHLPDAELSPLFPAMKAGNLVWSSLYLFAPSPPSMFPSSPLWLALFASRPRAKTRREGRKSTSRLDAPLFQPASLVGRSREGFFNAHRRPQPLLSSSKLGNPLQWNEKYFLSQLGLKLQLSIFFSRRPADPTSVNARRRTAGKRGRFGK